MSLLEITSVLPDDSREADEREEARRLRDLRGRVKAARAGVSRTPGLAETLASKWRKAARCYARFGISEGLFRSGAPAVAAEGNENIGNPAGSRAEAKSRVKAVLPGSADTE